MKKCTCFKNLKRNKDFQYSEKRFIVPYVVLRRMIVKTSILEYLLSLNLVRFSNNLSGMLVYSEAQAQTIILIIFSYTVQRQWRRRVI